MEKNRTLDIETAYKKFFFAMAHKDLHAAYGSKEGYIQCI